MALKERKQIEIDGIMLEARRKELLTVRDLMRLFGNVEDDEHGRPFIFPSQHELESEHPRIPYGDDDWVRAGIDVFLIGWSLPMDFQGFEWFRNGKDVYTDGMG